MVVVSQQYPFTWGFICLLERMAFMKTYHVSIKKLIALCCSIAILVTSLISSAYASEFESEYSGVTILTDSVPEEVIGFAQTEFARLIRSATNNAELFGLPSSSPLDYFLGQPIKVLPTEPSDDSVYYFPVFYGVDISAILTVVQTKDVLTSSFGRDFAPNLQSLINNCNGEYIIVATEKSLLALSQNDNYFLSGYPSEHVTPQQLDALVSNFDNLQKIDSQSLISSNYPAPAKWDPGAPTYSKRLRGFTGHYQLYGYGWTCWAAVATSIIQYKTEYKSITQRQVIMDVHGYADANKTATARQLLDLFNKYGLYPEYDWPLSFAEVRENIDSDSPLILTVGEDEEDVLHDIVAYGCEIYPGENYLIIFDPYNFDGEGGEKIIKVPSNIDDFRYVAHGNSRPWHTCMHSF